MVMLDNPAFVRSIYAQCFACFLHLLSSTLWVVSLSSAYWSRGSYSFLKSIDAVHTVGIWKTCITYINYEPYSKTWVREDGACWGTSRYLVDSRIELSSILSFVSCMFIAVIMALYGLLYTAKSWRPFIRQAALPGAKLIQMLVSLGMIMVFSEATDVAHNVRLWARHLSMATVVLEAAEVLFLLCVGLSYKTWQRGVRDLCGDISVYITGAAHQPTTPRSTVIMNNNSPALPLPPLGLAPILAPHEMMGRVEPAVEMLALQYPVYPPSVVLDMEEPTANYSTAGCRLGNYPKALRNIFGRTNVQRRLDLSAADPPLQRRLELSAAEPNPPLAPLPSIFLENREHAVSAFSDLPDRGEECPFPPPRQCDVPSTGTSSRSASVCHPRSKELSNTECSEPRVANTECSEPSRAANTECSESPRAATLNTRMRGRALPSPPRTLPVPVPRAQKVSDEVFKEQERRHRRPKEVRIVEKELDDARGRAKSSV